MAEFKGTKGKWEVVVQNETGSLITGMNGNETICTVWGNVDEFEANAQLIEAAPDLLEAIQYYFDVLEEVRGKNWNEKPDHVLSKMLNAVKKATE